MKYISNFPEGKLFMAFLISTAFLTGCYYDNEVELYGGGTTVDCNTVSAKYGADVSPIMSSQCATSGCHNSGSAAGGVILETYSQVSAKKDRIMERAVVQKSMPPSGALPTDQSNKIKCWIDGGALNN
jgi:uncharacterized membrane protein